MKNKFVKTALKPGLVVLLVMLAPVLAFCKMNFSAGGPGDQDMPADFLNAPSLRWKFNTSQPFMAAPVIDGTNVFAGGLDSTLYALDLATGKVNWKFVTSGEIRSAVLTDAQHVYLVGGDGVFYCLDKISGKPAWTTVFNKNAQVLGERKYDIADYFTSSPVMDGALIYFGSGDSRINALDAGNGQFRWTFQTNDIVHATPVVYNGKVFAGSFDGNLYALDAGTGRLLWKMKSLGQQYFPKGEMQGNPVAFNGLVFIGSRDYNLYAIDANGGYCHWNQQFPKGWALANVIQDSVLYTGTSEDRFIAAMDPLTGKESWRTNVHFNIFSPCVFSRSMLYVGNLVGTLFGIDRKNGAIKWTFTTDGYKDHHDTYFKTDGSFSDDFFKHIHNNVEYINAQLRWGALFSSPAISTDAMVITSTDGTMYCLVRS